MASERFAYVWQYTIDPRYEAEFLAAYRPGGDWARLFALDSEYLDTKLFRDSDRSDRYMTVDYWTSRSARDAFRERFAKQFQEIDARCESYTLDEVFVGDYVTIDDAAAT